MPLSSRSTYRSHRVDSSVDSDHAIGGMRAGPHLEGKHTTHAAKHRHLSDPDTLKTRAPGWARDRGVRKSLTPLKKRGPGEFLGHAHIEMDGGFIVELGKRAPSEFESYTGQVVGVTGTLDYDPYKHARESNAEHARVISGPPQLHDIVSIEVRLCPLR